MHIGCSRPPGVDTAEPPQFGCELMTDQYTASFDVAMYKIFAVEILLEEVRRDGIDITQNSRTSLL